MKPHFKFMRIFTECFEIFQLICTEHPESQRAGTSLHISIVPFSYNEIIGKNIRRSTTRKVTARTGNNSYLLTYVAQDMVSYPRSMM